MPAWGFVRLAIVGAAMIATGNVSPGQRVYPEGALDFSGCEEPSHDVKAGTIAPRVSRMRVYDDIVAEARHCAAQEKCSVAGGVKGCRCPVAVRASTKQRVDDAAREASCQQVERLYCPPLKNPRCEKQMCVADQVSE